MSLADEPAAGHEVPQPRQRLGLLFCTDHLVREHSIRMQIRAVTALFDVDDPLIQRNPLNRPQFLSSCSAQVLLAPQPRLLPRKSIPFHGPSSRSSHLTDEGKAAERRPLVDQILTR